jgi:cytoskeleton protein RodZ
MPLDTAAVGAGLGISPGTDRFDRGFDRPPMLEHAEHIGAALRATREHYRLSLEEVSLATHIRKAYLHGLEEMRLEALPARPFAIGYVRAYADVLGLDPDRAVARFKMEVPDESQALRAPVGVTRETDRRLRPMIVGGVVIVLAFLAWNIARHAMKSGHAAVASADVAVSSAKVHSGAPQGPIVARVGEPLPPPQESTLPTPYVTPGLAPAADAAAKPLAPPVPVGAPFTARGAVFGAPAGQSQVTLQASKNGLLIVRGADGAVYFARQLTAGQAWRAPLTPGLSVEASDPAGVDVFVGGLLKGPLPGPQTPISRLTGT